jgi:hypothetical protein
MRTNFIACRLCLLLVTLYAKPPAPVCADFRAVRPEARDSTLHLDVMRAIYLARHNKDNAR